MRNIQNRHKRIRHMNSFINSRLQRKLRKFAENPLLGFRASPLGFRVPLSGSRVPPTVPVLGSHFSDMPKEKQRFPCLEWEIRLAVVGYLKSLFLNFVLSIIALEIALFMNGLLFPRTYFFLRGKCLFRPSVRTYKNNQDLLAKNFVQ